MLFRSYAWTRWGIRRINRREGRPAIFYLHPWEIDPSQPRFRAGFVSRFRHYRNLDKTEGRLARLLRDFRFSTVRQVLSASHPELTSPPQTGLRMAANVQ